MRLAAGISVALEVKVVFVLCFLVDLPIFGGTMPSVQLLLRQSQDIDGVWGVEG